MEINFDYNGNKLVLVYSEKGTLEYVINTKDNKKMMIEYTQVGRGYEISGNNGYISMDNCNAVYVRIMGIDVFVPKYIFILNKKSEIKNSCPCCDGSGYCEGEYFDDLQPCLTCSGSGRI